MTIKSQPKASLGGHASPTQMHLSDALVALESHKGFSETRLRDLRSSIKRVAALLGDDPAHIPLDLPAVSAKLATISPAAAGLTSKSFSNIRSNFLRAVEASGLKLVQRPAKAPRSAAWAKLIADLSNKRIHIGLSRLAGHASAAGIEPEQINNAAIETFITAVRNGSLHRKPNDLHRKVTLIWNEVVRKTALNLQLVDVPSFSSPPKRIEWSLLTNAFRNDVDKYLTWCGGSDAFAADARSRALAPQTIKLRQNEIHAAITALVESGIKPTAIQSL